MSTLSFLMILAFIAFSFRRRLIGLVGMTFFPIQIGVMYLRWGIEHHMEEMGQPAPQLEKAFLSELAGIGLETVKSRAQHLKGGAAMTHYLECLKGEATRVASVLLGENHAESSPANDRTLALMQKFGLIRNKP